MNLIPLQSLPMNPKASPTELMAQFTAFPNILIDTLLPTLKDTEWRLLCVIVRQTVGWSERDGKRKQRDWLTQRQLIARTGRNSAALSAAIDVLVRRRLISTWNEGGELLMTPQERRRYRGRVYFGLCRETVQALIAKPSKTEVHKANRTKENKDKKEIIKKIKWNQRHETSEFALTLHKGWTQVGEIASSRYQVQDEDGGSRKTTDASR